MTATHYLRILGIILTVGGILAFAQDFLRTRRRLPDFLKNETHNESSSSSQSC